MHKIQGNKFLPRPLATFVTILPGTCSCVIVELLLPPCHLSEFWSHRPLPYLLGNIINLFVSTKKDSLRSVLDVIFLPHDYFVWNSWHDFHLCCLVIIRSLSTHLNEHELAILFLRDAHSKWSNLLTPEIS